MIGNLFDYYFVCFRKSQKSMKLICFTRFCQIRLNCEHCMQEVLGQIRVFFLAIKHKGVICLRNCAGSGLLLSCFFECVCKLVSYVLWWYKCFYMRSDVNIHGWWLQWPLRSCPVWWLSATWAGALVCRLESCIKVRGTYFRKIAVFVGTFAALFTDSMQANSSVIPYWHTISRSGKCHSFPSFYIGCFECIIKLREFTVNPSCLLLSIFCES